MKGKVKWFDEKRGFGFIENDEYKDIFVHYTAINLDGYKSLKENNAVSFVLIETEKGYQAKNVNLIKEKVNN